MNELIAQISFLEVSAVLFAVAYLVLAIRQSIWCWPCALISSVLSVVLFYGAQVYMQTGLQVFYAVMALYGWHQWLRGDHGQGVSIRRWRARTHVSMLVAILVTSALFVWLLGFTDEEMPVIDSFTTIAAIVTTYMVAQKILENWIYWLVIDSVSMYLYFARGLPLYALLFAGYLVLVVVGYRQWLREWRMRTVGASEILG